MTRKSILKLIPAVFLLMLFNIGAFAQRNDCSKTTDAETVKAIYEKIKVKYPGQIRHINVRIEANVITLEGWATTKKARDKIAKYAKKTNCVKKIVNNMTVGLSTGCGAGQKQCGDICIGKNETCNIVVNDN